jgi:stage V sporulation protein SpoVS
MTFLEKELGRARSSALISGDVNIWFWRIRWFIPSHEEEFWVLVTPEGRTAAHGHRIPEAAEGARLSAAEALELAEAFLAARSPSDLSLFELKAGSQTERPNRVDHSLRWEGLDEDLAGAKRKISVDVQGATVGSYAETLDLPETWFRDESRKEARRGFLMTAASTAKDGLLLLVFAIFVFNLRRWNMRFCFAVVLGGVLGILEILGWANEFPFIWMGYDTNESVSAFFGSRLVSVAANAMNTTFYVIIVGAAGDALAREVLPSRLSLSHLLTRGFWTSKQLFIASAAGCGLALLHAAYVAAFYVGGEHFGVWSPISPPYENILATPLPWLYPITAGLAASIDEEFLFRLFSISLLLRFAKNRTVAILLPAIIWGFLHSNYPQDPEYTRGLELTIVGVAYGAVFLRYGIVATLVSHYAYNALVSSVILLQSETPYLRLSGVAAVGLMAAPLLPGIWVLLRGKAFGEVDTLEQAPVNPVSTLPLERPVGEQPEPTYEPLPFRIYAALIVVAAAGLAFYAGNDRERLGDYVSIEANRVEAEAIAREFLEGRGVSLTGYIAVTEFRQRFSGDDVDFLHQQIGAGALNETLERHLPTAAVWTTDFFVPLQVESYRVMVLPRGEVFGYRRFVDDDAPGAKPNEAEALAIAEAFLREQGLDLSEYRLVDSLELEEQNRADHRFIWERVDVALGDGSLRVSTAVQGGEATIYSAYIDVPEEWTRKRAESGFGDLLLTTGSGLLLLLASATLGAVFVAFFLRGRLRWKLAIRAGALVGLLLSVRFANDYPAFWSDYHTVAEPFAYAGTVLIRQASYVVLAAAGSAIAVAYAEALFRRAFPDRVPIENWFIRDRSNAGRLGRRQRMFRGWGEALVVGTLLGSAAMSASTLVTQSVDEEFQVVAAMDIHESAPRPISFPMRATRWAALDFGTEALLAAGAGAAHFYIMLGFYYAFVRRPRLACSILVALLLAAVWSQSPTIADFVSDAPLAILAFAGFCLLLLFLIRVIVRDNIPMAIAAIFQWQTFRHGLSLAALPDTFLARQGYILLGVTFVVSLTGVALLWVSLKTPCADSARDTVGGQ